MNAFVGIASAVIVGVLLFGLLMMVVQDVLARQAVETDRIVGIGRVNRLYAACRRARAQGLKIHGSVFGVVRDGGVWRSDGPTCCPLGALLLGTPVSEDGSTWAHAARLLNVPVSWTRGFTAAFDGAARCQGDEDVAGFEAGLLLRQRLATDLWQEQAA